MEQHQEQKGGGQEEGDTSGPHTHFEYLWHSKALKPWREEWHAPQQHFCTQTLHWIGLKLPTAGAFSQSEPTINPHLHPTGGDQGIR